MTATAVVEVSAHLCECGCGAYTPLATRTDQRRNQIKGQPVRFLAGHNRITQGIALVKEQQSEEITPELILEMRGWDDKDTALALDRRVRDLERRNRRSFIELGVILEEMEDRQLWTKIGDPKTGEFYTSFNRWLSNAAPTSHTTACAALSAIRKLKDIPVAQLLEVPRCNVVQLAQLSTKDRKSTVKVEISGGVVEMPIVEAASILTEEKFADIIEEQKPDQHIERRRRVIAKQTKSQKKVLDEALMAAGAIYEVDTREGQLECLATFFLETECEMEKYEGLTNREAYQNILDNQKGHRSKKK